MDSDRNDRHETREACQPVPCSRTAGEKTRPALASNTRYVRFFAGFPALFCFLLLTGCGGAALEPVELLPEDMCAFCRMAISDKRFASELINSEGDVYKFDDIGCMLSFQKEKSGEAISAIFVVDFDTREWHRAEEAYFVRSKEFRTPMGGNLAAFKERPRAQAAATRYQGAELRHDALLER